MTTPTTPCVDRAFLMDLVGGDQDIAHELLESFQIDSRDLWTRLGEALTARDLEEVGRIGHALKGVAANMGSKPLRDAGAALQECSHTRDLTGSQALYQEVEALIESLADFLRTM